MKRTAMPPPKEPMSRGNGFQRKPDSPRVAERIAKAPRDTGFSQATKLDVRTRAGQGDPDAALCEGCGIWCGRYGGQIHHIVDREQADPEIRNTIINALLLHGTALTGCHGRATDCDPRFNAMGFWLYSWQKPGEEGVLLYGAAEEGGRGGLTVYLAPDGTYALEPPAGQVAS